MIKINLLETNKGKGKRGSGGGASMPTMEMGDMGSPKLKILVVVVIAGLFNLGYWYRLDHTGKAIAAQLKVAGLVEALRQEFSMPVELMNPFQRVTPPTEGMAAELVEQNPGQMAVAVGLALRSFESL